MFRTRSENKYDECQREFMKTNEDCKKRRIAYQQIQRNENDKYNKAF